MQGKDVALGVQLLPVVYPDNVAVQMPGGVNGDKGVAAVDLHSQSPGGVGQRAAYRTQADNAQALAPDLMAGKLGLALLHQPGHIGAALDGLHPVDAAHHIPAGQKHAAQGHLHHGVGVGAGGIEHHNALFGAGGQGNVVHTGTCPGHCQQTFRQVHLVHIGAAHQHRIRLLQVVHGLVVLRPQFHALGRNFIQRVNVIHDNSSFLWVFRSYRRFFCSKSAMNSTSFSTPSWGMAL